MFLKFQIQNGVFDAQHCKCGNYIASVLQCPKEDSYVFQFRIRCQVSTEFPFGHLCGLRNSTAYGLFVECSCQKYCCFFTNEISSMKLLSMLKPVPMLMLMPHSRNLSCKRVLRHPVHISFLFFLFIHSKEDIQARKSDAKGQEPRSRLSTSRHLVNVSRRKSRFWNRLFSEARRK